MKEHLIKKIILKLPPKDNNEKKDILLFSEEMMKSNNSIYYGEKNRMSGGIIADEWRYNEAPKDPNDTVADNLIRDILRSCNITPEERDRGIMFDWRRCDVIERGRRYESMKRR